MSTNSDTFDLFLIEIQCKSIFILKKAVLAHKTSDPFAGAEASGISPKSDNHVCQNSSRANAPSSSPHSSCFGALSKGHIII